MYEIDSPELYTIEEIKDLISKYGIQTAIWKIDIDKVPDKKLRVWLNQFEQLSSTIEDYVTPKKYVINDKHGRI